jgi:hypothetical protein
MFKQDGANELGLLRFEQVFHPADEGRADVRSISTT